MTNPKHSPQHCPAAALKLLGDYWTLRIIDTLQEEPLRFCQLQRDLGDVNPVTLTQRLKRLEEAAIIERKEETLDRQSVTYELSTTGKALLPVMHEIHKFTQAHSLA